MKSLYCFYSLLKIYFVEDFLLLIAIQAKTKRQIKNKNIKQNKR